MAQQNYGTVQLKVFFRGPLYHLDWKDRIEVLVPVVKHHDYFIGSSPESLHVVHPGDVFKLLCPDQPKQQRLSETRIPTLGFEKGKHIDLSQRVASFVLPPPVAADPYGDLVPANDLFKGKDAADLGRPPLNFAVIHTLTYYGESLEDFEVVGDFEWRPTEPYGNAVALYVVGVPSHGTGHVVSDAFNQLMKIVPLSDLRMKDANRLLDSSGRTLASDLIGPVPFYTGTECFGLASINP